MQSVYATVIANKVAFYWFILNKNKSKVGDCSQGRPEGSLFNSYYTKVYGRALLLSLDCSTLTLIRTLYCWVLSKQVVLSTIFKVFSMMWPGIEPKSPRPLANTLHIRPMSRLSITIRIYIVSIMSWNTKFILYLKENTDIFIQKYLKLLTKINSNWVKEN